MKRITLLGFIIFQSVCATHIYPRGTTVPTPPDTLRTTDIEEIVIVSTPKENASLRQQPLSSTSVSQTEMRQRGIDGVKALTANVPNLFIPDYGSRLTTSVYIRGIGSRTGTPAVALYVDGVPQVASASYDFNFSDVDRIDVLRGPQSTLYGRNSMGGVIRVFTKNPFTYQGTDVTLTGALLPSASSVSGSEGGPHPLPPRQQPPRLLRQPLRRARRRLLPQCRTGRRSH